MIFDLESVNSKDPYCIIDFEFDYLIGNYKLVIYEDCLKIYDQEFNFLCQLDYFETKNNVFMRGFQLKSKNNLLYIKDSYILTPDTLYGGNWLDIDKHKHTNFNGLKFISKTDLKAESICDLITDLIYLYDRKLIISQHEDVVKSPHDFYLKNIFIDSKIELCRIVNSNDIKQNDDLKDFDLILELLYPKISSANTTISTEPQEVTFDLKEIDEVSSFFDWDYGALGIFAIGLICLIAILILFSLFYI